MRMPISRVLRCGAGEGLWRRRYGADPDIIGTAIRMNGEPYTVVGIMPAM